MIPQYRKKYNEEFSEEKYHAFLAEMDQHFPGQIEFRIAETPIFVPKDFIDKALSACESIIDAITQPDYKEKSKHAIPQELSVPNEDDHPQFIAFDFGVCTNVKGELEPQLIEMQGFPSLFAFQVFAPEIMEKHFNLPKGFDHYLNGFTKESYIELLQKIIVGNEAPENVILLEIFPLQQKTRIDFLCTEKYLGIKTVCLTDIIQEGADLFYMNDGVKTPIKRIYNRLIFDDLFQQSKEVQEKGKLFQQELNVTWIPHPNWFYRISKFSLPFIKHPNIPETHFLHEVKSLPQDLENYVVKPLFSFAGQGVIIDVKKEDIENIKDPQNWILQRKVPYAAAIETMDEPAKAEMRLFYFWPEGESRPMATNNLARLSKGKMIGVRYNKDKTWTGGTYCLFEK